MLFKLIKEKINLYDKDDLSKKLGYSNQVKFEETLNEFLQFKNLYQWFEKGYYDLVNNAEDFFIKLSKALDIKDSLIDKELKEIKFYKQEVKKFKDSYIFINTNFKRKNEPIFALAFCENQRRISLYKNENLLFKTINEIFEVLSKEIKEHYLQNEGTLKIWGKINSYQVHLFGKIYLFDINGDLKINNEIVFEHKAYIKI